MQDEFILPPINDLDPWMNDEKTIPVIDDVDDEDDEDDDDDDVRYVVIETSQDLQLEVSHTKVHKQSWARMWALGCVNPTSRLPLTSGCKFPQPNAHVLAQLCL